MRQSADRKKYACLLFRSLLFCYIACGCISNISAKKVKLNLKAETAVDKSSASKKTKQKNRFFTLDSVKFNQTKSLIQFFGFEKNASSVNETFFIVNNSDVEVKKLDVTIIYSDMQDRMLHRRDESINIDLPAHETRMVTIRALDQQRSLYYYKSKPPRKGGMPFKVEILIKAISAEAAKPE